MTHGQDGNLPAALDRLYISVGSLIDPLKELHDGVIASAPSLYDQLLAELAATRTEGVGRVARRSLPPVWTDALDLRIEIDDTTRRWQPDVPSTPGRLRTVAARGWRPQDVTDIDRISGHVEHWAIAIRQLMSPTGVKHVSAPCPACNATYVYRRDSAGETVRVPALQIVTEIGCTCQACHYTWTPEYYLHLAKVLGIDSPAGVVS